MPQIKVGPSFLCPGIGAVLREIGITGAGEKGGAFIQRLRKGVRHESGNTRMQALLKAHLQAVVRRTAAGFLVYDIGKLWQGPWIRLHWAGRRLVNVARRQDFASL